MFQNKKQPMTEVKVIFSTVLTESENKLTERMKQLRGFIAFSDVRGDERLVKYVVPEKVSESFLEECQCQYETVKAWIEER